MPKITQQFWWGAIAGVAMAMAVWMSPLQFAFHAIHETRLAQGTLTRAGGKISPEFREYLKARVYLNVVEGVPLSWLGDDPLDYGPIDYSRLDGIFYGKGVFDSDDIYGEAMKKYRKHLGNR